MLDPGAGGLAAYAAWKRKDEKIALTERIMARRLRIEREAGHEGDTPMRGARERAIEEEADPTSKHFGARKETIRKSLYRMRREGRLAWRKSRHL